MKHILTLVLMISASCTVFGQNYFTKSGHIWFHSEAPLETIEAHNRQVTSILNTTNGEMVFKVLIKSFQFEKAMMQEHFNEPKYMDSDKYPDATFKGSIVDFESIDFSKKGIHEVTVKGDLTIHGVTQPVEATGTLTVNGGKIKAKSVFPVAVADYGVKIPGTVKDNIAEVVDITVEMEYDPM